ncbi:MAG: hypothetical protein LBC65_04400 [Oscillospiraceae bacterium]|nr:hypothetical protein [Oscillospiraceae bacterium]
MQQAFLSALTSGVAEQLPKRSVKSWLYRTAKNALIGEKRKQSRWVLPETDGASCYGRYESTRTRVRPRCNLGVRRDVQALRTRARRDVRSERLL